MVVLWRVELALRGRILSVFSHNCRMSNLLSENWRVRSYFWHRVNAKYQNTTNIDGREQRASAQYTLSNSKRSRSLTSKPFNVRNFDTIRVNLTPSFLPVPFSCYLFTLTLTRHVKSMWTPHPKDNECSLFLSNSMDRLSHLKFQQTKYFFQKLNLNFMPRSIAICPSFSRPNAAQMFIVGERNLMLYERKSSFVRKFLLFGKYRMVCRSKPSPASRYSVALRKTAS